MFPFESDTEIINIKENTLREYEVDFETGHFTGRIVEGMKALKTWIYIALRVSRYRHEIFTWDYGNELEDLTGKGYSVERVEEEAKNLIEECLKINPYIKAITDFACELTEDQVYLTFTVNSDFGSEGVELYV